MPDKEGIQRKVWLLPDELSDRIRAFQLSQGMGAEVVAARFLLNSALQMRDTVPDILRKLSGLHATEKDLRLLAKNVLATHPLVTSVGFEEDSVWFSFSDRAHGKIDRSGGVYIGARQGDRSLIWAPYPDPMPDPSAANEPDPTAYAGDSLRIDPDDLVVF